MDVRTKQLADNLKGVRERISIASDAAGRKPPTLIVVTKFHPAKDVRRLMELGVRDVGENRDQEAGAKAIEVAQSSLRWHFIGQLQKNKAKSVSAYAHSVHSIDRKSLIPALDRAVRTQADVDGRAPLECYIQVDLSAGPATRDPDASTGGRGGAASSLIPELALLIAQTAGLRLAGLMAVAPLGVDPAPAFDCLARYSGELVAQYPGATGISAGMSNDLEAAITAGATHLRVGSDILGPRPGIL